MQKNSFKDQKVCEGKLQDNKEELLRESVDLSQCTVGNKAFSKDKIGHQHIRKSVHL